MPYILIVYFLATGPWRLDHIDSIRFDNEQACNDAELQVAAKRAAFGQQNTVEVECVPAARTK